MKNVLNDYETTYTDYSVSDHCLSYYNDLSVEQIKHSWKKTKLILLRMEDLIVFEIKTVLT